MDKKIMPGRVRGEICAPASKSGTIRAVAAAALARGESTLRNASGCEDAQAAISCAKALGAKIEVRESSMKIVGGGKPVSNILDCNESGLCMRMFCAIGAALEGEFTLVGHGSLAGRKLGEMEKPLAALGAKCETTGGHAPVRVMGRMEGGNVKADGSQSSQFISGLLMALPLCKKDSELAVESLKSKPYVQMTISLLEKFGIRVGADEKLEKFKIKGGQQYKAREYVVEGDWSGASFPLVAGAIAGSSEAEAANAGKAAGAGNDAVAGVRVDGVRMDSLQADRAIVDALRLAGAAVLQEENGITVAKANLRAFEFDASDCPDLFPPIVALACNCNGKSILKGVGRLRHKESDRAEALANEFGKMGAKIRVQGDVMEIEGCGLKGCIVDSHNDHRIAMGCAVAALCASGETEIKNAECVGKSYPNFFEDLEKLRVR